MSTINKIRNYTEETLCEAVEGVCDTFGSVLRAAGTFLERFHILYSTGNLKNVISHFMSRGYVVNFSPFVLWGQE